MYQQFGGDWTEKKLECVKKYLAAYTKILSKTKFKYAYIDAFAGTGYREIKDEEDGEALFPELTDAEPESFLAGSVINALGIDPPFDAYIFIERDPKKCAELDSMIKTQYKELYNRIKIKNTDANEYLMDICRLPWTQHRAVLFLDPFGMQVKWKTIEYIAKTKAIDMWLLFPLGIGVSRLLKNDGQIKDAWKNKLDEIFGTTDWYKEFYKISIEDSLFGEVEKINKEVDLEGISNFFIKRLKTILHKVSEKPVRLVNSKNNPLFLLCFAAGNPVGAKTAVKIADDLLKRI
jgi:three-Cys-motif partner protein